MMRVALKLAVVLAGFSCAGAAFAVHTDTYRIPYAGIGLTYLGTDAQRETDAGGGYQFTFGVPRQSEKAAIELTFFDLEMSRTLDGKSNFATGLIVDYVRDYGLKSYEGGPIPRFKPFWLLGAGFSEEDSFGTKSLHLAVNAGAGLFFPIGFKGWALRTEARAQWQANDETLVRCTNNTCTGPGTVRVEGPLIDYKFSVALQIPMTLFFDRDLPIEAEAECDIAVVGSGGRDDCARDSDRDGIPDGSDQCPGTPPATPVEPSGCPVGPKAVDSDGDGVVDEDDRCPATQKDLGVDASGCVTQQNVNIYGVSFEPDSADLTAEARATLDSVAATFNAQTTLRMEVAAHTDNVGSEPYNLALSQQRADAVRAYLAGRGVSEDRLTAVGYGSGQPVAFNDTEPGRAQNRRVEFRIVVE